MTLPGHMNDETHFVFNGFSHLLTETERLAWKNLQVQFKREHTSSEPMDRALSKWLRHSPAVDALLADGSESFYRRVVQRLHEEHGDDLNLCPKCGALCRTPTACLCPACNHTWYHNRQESDDASRAEPPP